MKKRILTGIALLLCLTGCTKKPVVEEEPVVEKKPESSPACIALRDPKERIEKAGSVIKENVYRIPVRNNEQGELTYYICDFNFYWFYAEEKPLEDTMIYDWSNDTVKYQGKIYNFLFDASDAPQECKELRTIAIKYLVTDKADGENDSFQNCVNSLHTLLKNMKGRPIDRELRITRTWNREGRYLYSTPVWGNENAKYVCDFMNTSFRYESDTLEDTIVYNWGKDVALYQGETYHFLDNALMNDVEIPQQCKDLRIMALWYLNTDRDVLTKTNWDDYAKAIKEYTQKNYYIDKPNIKADPKRTMEESVWDWEEIDDGIMRCSYVEGGDYYNCFYAEYTFNFHTMIFSCDYTRLPENERILHSEIDLQNNTWTYTGSFTGTYYSYLTYNYETKELSGNSEDVKRLYTFGDKLNRHAFEGGYAKDDLTSFRTLLLEYIIPELQYNTLTEMEEQQGISVFIEYIMNYYK